MLSQPPKTLDEAVKICLLTMTAWEKAALKNTSEENLIKFHLTDNGFPCQLVAQSKYGYKWAKWITRVELSSNTNFRGYWETNGYNNNADITGPSFNGP